jgi:hypothetical protein
MHSLIIQGILQYTEIIEIYSGDKEMSFPSGVLNLSFERKGYKMKKIIFCFFIALFAALAFSEEIVHPDYAYFFAIRSERDVETTLNTIKTWVAKYSNYSCTIADWDTNGENLGALAIRMVQGFMSMQGQISEVAVCQLYLRRSVINIYLSNNEIAGLTQKYTPAQVDSVYDDIYDLYYYNMR